MSRTKFELYITCCIAFCLVLLLLFESCAFVECQVVLGFSVHHGCVNWCMMLLMQLQQEYVMLDNSACIYLSCAPVHAEHLLSVCFPCWDFVHNQVPFTISGLSRGKIEVYNMK